MAFSLFKGPDKVGGARHSTLTVERMLASGEFAAAEATALALVESSPDDAAPRVVLGMALKAQGRLRGALAAFEAAVERNPGDVEALTDLAEMCLELGLLEEALFIVGQAVKLAPTAATTRLIQARALDATLRPAKAAQAYLVALGSGSISPAAQEGLITVIERSPEVVPDRGNSEFAQFRAALITAFQAGQAETSGLATAAGIVISRAYELGTPECLSPDTMLDELSEDELFIRLLQETINVDPVVERFCIELRDHLLTAYCHEVELPVAVTRLAAALSLQAYHNEYAMPCGDAELAQVDRLAHEIEGELNNGKPSPIVLRGKLLMLAMYAPLSSHPRADRIMDLSLGGEVQRVVALTVRERREVEALRDRIPAIGNAEPKKPTSGGHQLAEANPYPRWIHIARPESGALSNYLRSRFPAYEPPVFSSPKIDVLVPGCGTGQYPIKTAIRFPGAQVTAVDISLDSLAYGARMARKLSVGNVEFMLGDLMRLPDEPARYHYIECTHLLHHVAAHEDAWAALSALLRPGGVLKVDVPSKHGRADVAAVRELVTRLSLPPDTQGIRKVRQKVFAGSAPSDVAIMTRPDFYTVSGCRELLFHVPVTRYALDGVYNMVEQHGLRMVGLFADPVVRTTYRKACPDDPNMADRTSVIRFERDNPKAFRSVYQLLCEKPA